VPCFSPRCRAPTIFFARSGAGPCSHRAGAKEAILARDQTWGASITLLASPSPATIAVLPLVQIERRTWIPGKCNPPGNFAKPVHMVDPGAAKKAGLPSLRDLFPVVS